MLKRQFLFFTLLLIPVLGFSIRHPAALSFALVAAVGAWWSASPVSHPKWIIQGLLRALPLAAAEALALGWICR